MSGRFVIVFILAILAMGVSAEMCRCAEADEIQKYQVNQRNFNAIQYVYQKGVPHTDGKASPMMNYESGRSFLPISMWGAPNPGEVYGEIIDWKVLLDAGINTVWPWPNGGQKASLKAGNDSGMKIILMGSIKPEELNEFKNDPALFGNVWMDEPIGGVGSRDMDKLFDEFQAYRKLVHETIPGLPVFINDAPWITQPATNTWVKWNSSAEISCHDNYPILNRKARAVSIGAEPGGIPQSVGLAVASNNQMKPVWLIVGGFEQTGEYGQVFPFRFPTPEQLRACVYAGIVHGATGIVYFIWDTYVQRDGEGFGMSPNPKVAYTPNPQKEGYSKPTPASPVRMIKSRALWETMVQVNSELKTLTPSIFSPTVGDDFKYALDIVGKAPTDAPIRCLLKPHPDGGYVLLSVNLDDAVLKVTYTMPKEMKSAEILFENRQPEKLSADSKSFTLTYEPFDTHVVRINI